DTVRVETADGSTTGRLESATTAEYARYVLDEPVTGAVVVPVETGVAISASEREPAGSLVGGTGDPMIRVLCRFDDPRAVRFELKYSTGHPPMSRWMLYWLPVAWPILAGGA